MKTREEKIKIMTLYLNQLVKKGYFVPFATGFLLALLLFELVPVLLERSKLITFRSPVVLKSQVESKQEPKEQTDLAKVASQVMPERFGLGVAFGDKIMKMIETGAIDKQKFLALYEGRQPLTEQERRLLEASSNEEIVVTSQNANFILNLLWPLGIANKTSVLSDGPMGKEYKDQVGNFASTGGWTLGREEGGKLFNRFNLINLTSEQEAVVREIAENIYRPCCGNSTYFPDCNHGAAMLGFVELAVASGMSKDEIYKKALVLNSYWFPQNYTELAIYFKAKKGIDWSRVDAKEVLGVSYSSGQGARSVNKQLQDEGLLPKVEGGGGCGV